MQAIVTAARTGKIGDGKIFLSRSGRRDPDSQRRAGRRRAVELERRTALAEADLAIAHFARAGSQNSWDRHVDSLTEQRTAGSLHGRIRPDAAAFCRHRRRPRRRSAAHRLVEAIAQRLWQRDYFRRKRTVHPDSLWWHSAVLAEDGSFRIPISIFCFSARRPREPRPAYKDPIRRFSQELWDLRMKLSPATRTLAECDRFDAANVEFTISLLDCRYLLGDRELFHRLHDKIIPKLVMREAAVPGAELGRSHALTATPSMATPCSISSPM